MWSQRQETPAMEKYIYISGANWSYITYITFLATNVWLFFMNLTRFAKQHADAHTAQCQFKYKMFIVSGYTSWWWYDIAGHQ